MARVKDKLFWMQKNLGYQFKDIELLKSALTHPSATEGLGINASYERLEFLGDSIVGFVVSEELYRLFPDLDEGALSRIKVALISGESMTAVARAHGFEDCIIFGLSERGTGARGLRSALENVYEAVTGALYLDGGLDVARDWVLRSLKPHEAGELAVIPDSPKSMLQEKTQEDLRQTPTYQLLSTEGPAHEPTFVCACLVGGEVVGTGRGSSKKLAETNAAREALVHYGYLPGPTSPDAE